METPSPARISQMICGYWISQAIYVAAKLGLSPVDTPTTGQLVEPLPTVSDAVISSGDHQIGVGFKVIDPQSGGGEDEARLMQCEVSTLS